MDGHALTDIADSLHAPISEQEFTDALDHLQKNQAPGPSMVTTNMIRAWSPNTRHNAFVLLNILWKNKEVPEWWADDVLCPIPKKPGENTLKNVRPIGLLEVIRKVWTGNIIRRIQAQGDKHSLLHHSQHVYRGGMALTQPSSVCLTSSN
jgi:hypothetical protein